MKLLDQKAGYLSKQSKKGQLSDSEWLKLFVGAQKQKREQNVLGNATLSTLDKAAKICRVRLMQMLRQAQTAVIVARNVLNWMTIIQT